MKAAFDFGWKSNAAFLAFGDGKICAYNAAYLIINIHLTTRLCFAEKALSVDKLSDHSAHKFYEIKYNYALLIIYFAWKPIHTNITN
jgi:hypothetical protein